MDVKGKLLPTASHKSPDPVCKKWRDYDDRGKNQRDSEESVSSSIMSISENELLPNSSQSLRESSDCSFDSLNQDLPAHMQLVPFSSKSAKPVEAKKPEKAGSASYSNTPRKVKNIKNVCTPQAIPMPRKAETNYDMEELVETLPKLKVTTPARIHDESRGAFSAFATPPRVVATPKRDVTEEKPDINFCAMNPVDIEPINPFVSSEFESSDAGIIVQEDIFAPRGVHLSDSASKSNGKLCWKNSFDLQGGLSKASSFLFKAQRSLFSETGGAATENAGLSDSLVANVGTPQGVNFKGEQFSPNLSFVATSPSNDSESSFIMPSQNTDCDYLMRRISYDPTVDNMVTGFSDRSHGSSNSSNMSTCSYIGRVNVPSVIEELRESPEKSPTKTPESVQSSQKMESEESARTAADGEDKGLPPVPPKQRDPIASGVFEAESKISQTVAKMILRNIPGGGVNMLGMSAPQYDRSTASFRKLVPPPSPRSGARPPWTPSGRVRYTNGPYSQIKLFQENTPVRKIQFGRTTPSSEKCKLPVSMFSTPSKYDGRRGAGIPRSEGRSSIPVPKAKRPVYRRGTPHQKSAQKNPGKLVDSPVSSKKQRTLSKFRLVDTNVPQANKEMRQEENVTVEEKKEKLRQLREVKARLAAKLGHHSPVAGRKRPLSSPVTLPPKRHPLVTMGSENTPRVKKNEALSLGEKELEAVTMLHTLCNSQQAVKFVTKPSRGMARHSPSPKVASKLQWREELIGDTCRSHLAAQAMSMPSPARPILSERAPEQLYPYCDQPPSPVIVRRTVKKSHKPFTTTKLGFF